MEIAVLFGSFFILLLLSVPVGHAIGISGLLSFLICTDYSPMVFIKSSLSGTDSFTLLAVPFFMLAGNLMATGGIAKRIVNFADSLLGWLTGGLSIVTTIACMFFGAVSGSAVATTSAIGSFMIPEMEKKGYDKDFSAALAAAAGSVGVIIPPSVPLVIYGVAVNASVKDLFTAGILPGIMMGIAMIIVCVITSRKHGWKGDAKRPELKKVWKAFKEGFWALLMPVIILGGIYKGIFTPTEASVVSVVYCIVVSMFVYKEMDLKGLYKGFLGIVNLCGITLFMMGFANAFSYFLTIEQIPNRLTELFLGISHNKFVILLMINILLLIVGCVIDNIPATIILAPILLPVVKAMGMSPTTFGVMLTMNLAIGFITPPYGINLFMATAVSGVPMDAMMKRIGGLLASLLVVLMLITYVPWFTLGFLS